MRRLWLALGWMLVLLVIFLSVTPSTINVPVEGGDKLSHVLAYFMLMSWFANIYHDRGQQLLCAIAFISMGVVLEFLQGLMGHRSLDVLDAVANAAGVAVGWMLAPPRFPNYLHLIEKTWEAGAGRARR